MPYSDAQALTGVPNVIDDMNNQDIEFSVHDGDLKAGNAITGSVTPTTCQIAQQPTIYSQGLGYFNSLEKPAIFTPGDNDWTDCDRTTNGGFNALERLQYERGLFFSTDKSLGKHTMKLDVQKTAPYCLGTRTPAASRSRRRASRTAAGRTTTSPSSRSTCRAPATTSARAAPATREATRPSTPAREAADERWLEDAFDEANARNSAGLMVIWQADPGFDTAGFQGAPKRDPKTLVETDGNPDGFHDLLVKLRDRTIAFQRPVVLVHGDSHYFIVDKPLLDADGRRVENFTRVETFGDHTFATHPDWDTNDNHWVKALVDPHSRDVFAFQAQIVPENRVAVPAPSDGHGWEGR